MRLIRSKGVGVFFITQLPDDVPDVVLAQLGNRVQHGLRAYTPRDAKALKAAVSTYPKTDDYDLEEALTQLGIGEAMVTVLADNGAPTPVAWTRVRPPQSQIGAVDPAEVTTHGRGLRALGHLRHRARPPLGTGDAGRSAWASHPRPPDLPPPPTAAST